MKKNEKKVDETTVLNPVDEVVNPSYWVCIIGPVDRGRLPYSFDSPPRTAATEAIEEAGIEVKNCWSGWGCDERHFNDIMNVWNRE